MVNYRYTNKLLFWLGVGNILIIGLSLWTFWKGFRIALAPIPGDGTVLFVSLLFNAIIENVLSFSFAWLFFKQRGFALFFYIPYMATSIPMSIVILYSYWKDNDPTWSYLDSKVYTWWSIILFITALGTLASMLIETNYPQLKRKIHLSLDRILKR